MNVLSLSDCAVRISFQVTDDDIDDSMGCAHFAIEDAIGEPQTLTVDVDETAINGTVCKASTHVVTVTHVRHSAVVMFVHPKFGMVVSFSCIVTVLGITSRSGAGH